MRWLGILVFLVVLSHSVRADFVEIVRNTKNSSGAICAEIPSMVKKAGFKELAENWLVEKIDGIYKVTLRIIGRKDGTVDSMYLSYNWRSEWIWYVREKDGSVKPMNNMARNWMAGKI